uniref:Uncharacterized protein n=1 Tax=Aegilops tauschii subsp. strangulata TaxID=200361 RepID=A0A452YL76_AEGTS
VAQHGERGLLVLVLDLLGRRVGLLLVLLGAVAEAEDQVRRRLLRDVVAGQRAPVLQLLPGEDEPLLVRRDPLLVLEIGLHVVNHVRRLHLQRDRLPRQRLHKDLHLALARRDLPPVASAAAAAWIGIRESGWLTV